MQKIVAGVTTKYLVATVNPTGYAQVVYQTFSGTGITEYWRQFVYGLDRISQYRSTQSGTQKSYYVYDGHGSVRALTDGSGNVTDTYDYDAFGNVTHQTGATPNEFLFAGEQYDSNLHLYYNRARYLNTSTGRFWSMDTYEGDPQSPLSLHKYLYTGDDPVDNLDPSGKDFDLESLSAAVSDLAALASQSFLQFRTVLTTVYLTLGQAVPLLVERGAFYLATAGLGLKVISEAPTALQLLAQNIEDYTGTFPAGNFPRGIAVGHAAEQDLSDTFPVFDNFDFETGEGTQIFSTTQIQTSAKLVAAIRAKAQAFQQGFESRDIFRGKDSSNEVFVRFTREEVKTRNMLVVTPPNGNFSLSQIADDLEKIEAEFGLDDIEVVESKAIIP